MKKAEFIQEVCKEINTIKERATQKEIVKLNFENFEHSHTEKCIYGMLTGDCSSQRAKQLYQKSLGFVAVGDINYNDIKEDENGNDIYKFKDLDLQTKGNEYTYLEYYLFTCGRKVQKQIIQYLKGEINELYIK